MIQRMRSSSETSPSVLRSPADATRSNTPVSHHTGLLLVLATYLIVSVGFGLLNPLAEAPDEIAHMELIRFIGRSGHLPWNDDDRAEAGYKSDTPMLYHLILGKLVGWVGPEDRPHLKVNSLSPQRLLVSDGLSPFTLVHTWDETFPYRGIVLSWHLARLVSTLLGLASLWVVFRLGKVLVPGRPELALTAVATVAALSQFHFLAASVNDDNLLGLLGALYTLWLIKIWKEPGRWPAYALVGLWFGLAITTKYSVTPLVLLLPLLLVLLLTRGRLTWRQAVGRFSIFGACACAAAAWWFVFVEWHFNQVATLGPWTGLIQPLMAGRAADVTLRHTAAVVTGGTVGGSGLHPPTLSAWGQWLAEMFRSFWIASNNVGGITNMILSLAFLGLAALTATAVLRASRRGPASSRPAGPILEPAIVVLFIAQILLMLPFPLLRFWITRNVAETAQGRHILIPALPAVGLLLTCGWWQLFPATRKRFFAWVLPAGLLLVSLVCFFGYRLPAFPPPLPVRTTPMDTSAFAQTPVEVFDSSIELVDVSVAEPNASAVLPVTLIWRSLKPVTQDFLVTLWLSDTAGNVVTSWLGHPVDGRYPTRAWEQGDVVQDTVWLPTTAVQSGTYELGVNLCPADALDGCLDTDRRPVVSNVIVPKTTRSLPQTELALPDGTSMGVVAWHQDHALSIVESFGFRAAVPVTLSPPADSPWANAEVFLLGPDEAPRVPLLRLGNDLTFLVAADWRSGPYRLQLRLPDGQTVSSPPLLDVSVRQRRFDVPPMEQTINANFGDELELMGYDFPIRRIQPGGQMPLTLYWRARKAMQNPYVVFNHLLKSDDLHQWGGQDRVPQDYYSTVLWAAGEVVVDSYVIPVNPQAPAGIYRLDVGVYLDQDGTARSLPLVAAGQALDSSSVTIGSVKVGGPPPDLTVARPTPQVERSDNLANQVTLLGYDLVQKPAALTVTLYWNCQAPVSADLTTFVHLRSAGDPNGPPAAQMDRPPADGAYPTSLWDPGETIRDRIVVPLTSDLPAGEYVLVVGLYNPQNRPTSDRFSHGGWARGGSRRR